MSRRGCRSSARRARSRPKTCARWKTSDGPAPRRTPATAHLLDRNLLYALIDESPVHHAPARGWFTAFDGSFATCPITQGTLLRLAMRLGGRTTSETLTVLQALTAHPRHLFWPDDLGYSQIRWDGVMGHRQVTDAYLAALARHHGGRLATFDNGLVALHPDVAVGVELT